MRIQCKGCGKEYQVDESRLTRKWVQVRCRSCGTVLRIRLRQEQKTPPVAEDAVPSTRAEKSPEDIPSMEPTEKPVEAPEPEEAPEPKEAPKPARVPSGYRFCISCGKRLEKVLSVDERPVCETCGSMAHGGAPAAVPGGTEQKTSTSFLKKVFLFFFIILILFLAAVMGYRIARGDLFPSSLFDRNVDSFSPIENIETPILEDEKGLFSCEEFL